MKDKPKAKDDIRIRLNKFASALNIPEVEDMIDK